VGRAAVVPPLPVLPASVYVKECETWTPRTVSRLTCWDRCPSPCQSVHHRLPLGRGSAHVPPCWVLHPPSCPCRCLCDIKAKGKSSKAHLVLCLGRPRPPPRPQWPLDVQAGIGIEGRVLWQSKTHVPEVASSSPILCIAPCPVCLPCVPPRRPSMSDLRCWDGLLPPDAMAGPDAGAIAGPEVSGGVGAAVTGCPARTIGRMISFNPKGSLDVPSSCRAAVKRGREWHSECWRM
jgi:hypothetical protein